MRALSAIETAHTFDTHLENVISHQSWAGSIPEQVMWWSATKVL